MKCKANDIKKISKFRSCGELWYDFEFVGGNKNIEI